MPILLSYFIIILNRDEYILAHNGKPTLVGYFNICNSEYPKKECRGVSGSIIDYISAIIGVLKSSITFGIHVYFEN